MGKTFIRLALSAPCSFALCLPADAQQPEESPSVGYLSSYDSATESTRVEGIRLALRKLGYIEGQNIGHRVTDMRRKARSVP